jgi:hypothetical protein
MVKGIVLPLFWATTVAGFSQSPTFDAASIKPSKIGQFQLEHAPRVHGHEEPDASKACGDRIRLQ